jgi:hypothetical protein
MSLKNCQPTRIYELTAPTLHEFFVAEVEGALQVLQLGHQSDGQAGAVCGADARADLDLVFTEQIRHGDLLSRAGFAGEVGCQRLFNRAPGKSFAQHHQRVVGG